MKKKKITLCLHLGNFLTNWLTSYPRRQIRHCMPGANNGPRSRTFSRGNLLITDSGMSLGCWLALLEKVLLNIYNAKYMHSHILISGNFKHFCFFPLYLVVQIETLAYQNHVKSQAVLSSWKRVNLTYWQTIFSDMCGYTINNSKDLSFYLQVLSC